MGPSKRKPAKKSKPSARRSKSADGPGVDKRIGQLEKLVDLLLQAVTRGRLLPNERRTIKRHLEQRRVEKKQARDQKREREGPRCPACRLLIPDEKAEKCPHCSVLLAVARRSRRER